MGVNLQDFSRTYNSHSLAVIRNPCFQQGVAFVYTYHLVRAEEFERRHAWPPDWPAAGAREAPARGFPEGEDAYFEGMS